ncbi:DUF1479-domain-containing protein [Trametopsis cervina]|nr:DUF1479-domain-containing protein [Trametopsis cervina]
MATQVFGPLPPRFIELKKEIAGSHPDFEKRVTAAWADLLKELKTGTDEIAAQGSEIVPQVDFSELDTISESTRANIVRRGCVVIRNVVPDKEATSWRVELQQYVKENPVEGFPEEDKQFFQLYWTRPQVRARAHPNVLAASTWLNKFYHVRSGSSIENVDLSAPLSYADRFRMRHPGGVWDKHPPHIDGGGIERWEDEVFRKCFADILSGNWREHDAYDLVNRINARSSLYGRPNQSTVFRTYQGWLALSETAPTQGTLQVFPNVLLSNAYLILRPFFTPTSDSPSDIYDAGSWKYDISEQHFPGIYSFEQAFTGPRPNPKTHPNLQLEKTMVSVPRVNPGDMVFWHCDVIHAVEFEHTGAEDSCVMYIPAVPSTPANASYIARQKESFLQGLPPPDFPKWAGEGGFTGLGKPEDIDTLVGRKAMGLPIEGAA